MSYQLQHVKHTTPNPIIYICFGLGSFIGLFLEDRITGLMGGVHVPLPTSLSAGEFLGIARLIELLLSNFRMAGRNLNFLVAMAERLVQVYRLSFDVGRQNIKTIIQDLTRRSFFGSIMKKSILFNDFHLEINLRYWIWMHLFFGKYRTG